MIMCELVSPLISLYSLLNCVDDVSENLKKDEIFVIIYYRKNERMYTCRTVILTNVFLFVGD